MCSAQNCTFWQRGAEPTTCNFARALSVSFEHPRSLTWTSPQLTTSAFLESSSLCRALCESRTRSSFSAIAFTVTHIVKVTGKGATTTLPIPSPSRPCSWRRDRRSKLRKARRTQHENKESISMEKRDRDAEREKETFLGL